MKILFFLLTLFLSLFLSSCGDEDRGKGEEKEIIPSKKVPKSLETNKIQLKRSHTKLEAANRFNLSGIDDNNLTFILSNTGDILKSEDIKKPLILVNLFASWSPPCRSELPELSKLQKKYKKDLFVLGLMVNDDLKGTPLKYFTKKHSANHFIVSSKSAQELGLKIAQNLKLPQNFPIPLSVIFKNGKLYRHYEGSMPIEMLDYEIQQAMKQL